MKTNRIIKSGPEKLFDLVFIIILISISLITIIPFMQVVTISMSPLSVTSSYGLHLFPTKLDFSGYSKIINYKMFWVSYKNTFVRTIAGTGLSLFLYVITAYPLSKSHLPHRKLFTILIIVTMYFSGGLIPDYLLISNGLKLTNTIWALILPGALNAYTLIIVRNFFEAIPSSLEESAKMDGANDIKVLFTIYLPMSKACIATISLWSVVFHWNQWFDCVLYIREESKYVMQYTLQKIILDGTFEDTSINLNNIGSVNTDTMKMAALVVSIIPIMLMYPFIQQYFTKGVMVGAVKG